MFESHSDFVRAIERRKISPGIYSVKMVNGEVFKIKFTDVYYPTEVRVG